MHPLGEQGTEYAHAFKARFAALMSARAQTGEIELWYKQRL